MKKERFNPAGVVGMGLMGKGIVVHLLNLGYEVVAIRNNILNEYEIISQIIEQLDFLQGLDRLNGTKEELLNRLCLTTEFIALQPCRIVIETITENKDEKVSVFKKIEDNIACDAVIGSNTSALPISMLQQGLKNPDRFMGIHWADPAYLTKFMEITCGDNTNQQIAQEVARYAEDYWMKEPAFLRKDIRGFLANRLMYALFREAFFLVENGYANIEDIDRVLRNDMGSWLTFAGPFRFMDLTGLYPSFAAMPDLLPTLCNSDQIPKMLANLVSNGAAGVSNRKGFYQYTPKTAQKWKQLFVEFSSDIRHIANKYGENAGDK
jgi:3-hydroxybutyryl-CoA dehydrogenase